MDQDRLAFSYEVLTFPSKDFPCDFLVQALENKRNGRSDGFEASFGVRFVREYGISSA